MQAPPLPDSEITRVATLRGLAILDTPPEERFDRVTRLACRLFRVPIALVSLVDSDRQWFKSKQGLSACETARAVSFCGHAILSPATLVVPDAHLDPRFVDNPLVIGQPSIRFYAGHPLQVDGERIGTLCLIDTQPRTFSSDDQAALHDLAAMVERELEAIRIATIDELTGLANRRGFTALAEHSIALARRHDVPQSLLYLDLDQFKAINDRFGHAAGDRALVETAQLLRMTFRESDVIARLGGDEFCVLLTGVDAEQLPAVVGRLEHALAAANARPDRVAKLSCSVGAAAIVRAAYSGLAALLAQADQRMYQQKRARKAQTEPLDAATASNG